jgi:mRNA-degrading endonuclease RelE of RelBE toxin-antitoxin system
MLFRVELSKLAQEQIPAFPKCRAIDELERRDDSQWSNVKALQGSAWKGRYRKRAGSYRIIFRKLPDRGVVEISAALIKSKDTYR